jgi:hypothetical protein
MPDDAPPQTSIILYQTEDGRTRIQCRFQNETIWLTQALIAELFQKDVRTINEHLVNVFNEGELSREATIRKFRIVRAEGAREVSREVEHYRLEAILAVGYRVRSHRGTQFRQWATARLTEFLVKGFAMDDERLKNPPGKGYTDYFDELLERIRDIRSSERRVYLRVREILALAADYSPSEPETQHFFQTVQNKLHFAATGKTAAELIAERANASEPNMGLTAWKSGAVRKGDVTVAKNYLRENEISELNRIVVMFLDFAEDQARRRKQIFLHNWQTRLDDFLRLNERAILPDSGKSLANTRTKSQKRSTSDLLLAAAPSAKMRRRLGCSSTSKRRSRRRKGRERPGEKNRQKSVSRGENRSAAMRETKNELLHLSPVALADELAGVLRRDLALLHLHLHRACVGIAVIGHFSAARHARFLTGHLPAHRVAIDFHVGVRAASAFVTGLRDQCLGVVGLLFRDTREHGPRRNLHRHSGHLRLNGHRPPASLGQLCSECRDSKRADEYN